MSETRRSQRPSLGDVAREAGVSPALASLALRGRPGPAEASREAVLEAAQRLGYRANIAASVLARRRTRLIGVAFDIGQSFHVEAIDHVYREAEGAGYEVVLGAVTESRPLEKVVGPLVGGSCEGVLLIGAGEVPASLLASAATLPVVVLGHAHWQKDFDVVRTAGDRGEEEAVDKLVSLGHRHIVHVDGGSASGAEERRVGYRTAMARHGLADLARLVHGGHGEADGLRAGRRLLQDHPETTAVICYNDSCAVGVIQAIEEEGLGIPRDISVIGYDNSPVSRTNYLSLTTVAQDTPKLTALAVSRLVAAIEDHDLEREEFVLPPHVVERTTTGRVRRSGAGR